VIPRLAILGCLIVALGVAVCYGAVELWTSAGSFGVVSLLQIVGAIVAAVLGVANVVAGIAILLIR